MTLEDFYKRIETQYNQQLPFVAYRKPNVPEIQALLQTTNDIHYVETYNESGFVFAPFDDSNKSVLIPLILAERVQAVYVNQNVINEKHSEVTVDNQTKEHHISLVKKGIAAIKNNTFKKVVLSRQETLNISEVDLIQLFETLLTKYPLAFVYCWYHPKIGLWLGATPETLMKIEGNQFSMMALAGTQEYKGFLNVVWDDKEKEEQQIVTDFIIENLNPFVEHIKTSEVETVKAGNLLHLKTMISAKLKVGGFNLKEIISSLHPTPAVCGLPKYEAKAFILEHEHYNREFYTGYLGELNFESKHSPRSSKRNIENRAYAITKKSSQLYVNLRCMQIKGRKALIYVGGGITKISNAENEWEETVSKSKVIKSVL